MRRVIKHLLQTPSAVSARLRQNTSRAARFSGVYPSRDAALASLPESARSGYDNADIADVSFEWMCQRAAWDYPLLYWLQNIAVEKVTVLDAGGHLGTKYIAFSDIWDMQHIHWTVYDTPGIIAAAKARQAAGDLPEPIRFHDDLGEVPACEILLASGLVQYLDQSLSTFLMQLKQRPKHILLNKVPLRDGKDLFTVERIGTARVPYHIRSRQTWEAELANLGYEIVDRWEIAGLSHRISTHPWQGQTDSAGYYLRWSEPGAAAHESDPH